MVGVGVHTEGGFGCLSHLIWVLKSEFRFSNTAVNHAPLPCDFLYNNKSYILIKLCLPVAWFLLLSLFT